MPQVSIIIPCYNEENTIYPLLEAIYNQEYPRSELEVLIAEGGSDDKTLEKIHLFQYQHPDFSIVVVDNPIRIIPAGLNLAIRAAHGEYIIRLDAHCIPYPDYVSRCIHSLKAGMGANVGGRWDIQPGSSTWIARAIAFAAAHPFGVGGARYGIGGQAQSVETVPFGAFNRSLVDEIGYFNEELLTNEDYEFNARIREKGLVVWFDPQIRSILLYAIKLSKLGKAILAVRFLESSHDKAISRDHAMATTHPTFICSEPGHLFTIIAFHLGGLICLID